MNRVKKEQLEMLALLEDAKKKRGRYATSSKARREEAVEFIEERLEILDRMEATEKMDYFVWMLEVATKEETTLVPLHANNRTAAIREARKLVGDRKVKRARLYRVSPVKVI